MSLPKLVKLLHRVKERPKTVGFIAVLIVIALTIIVAVVGRENKGPLVKVLPQGVDIQIKDIVYTDVGKDGTRLEIQAKKGQYFKEEGKAVFDGLIAVLEQPGGHRYTLTGDRGTLWTQKQKVDIYGHVVMLWETGERVMTDTIHYNGAKRTLWTDDDVVHEGSRVRVEGKGLIVYLDKKSLKLKSQVKATIK